MRTETQLKTLRQALDSAEAAAKLADDMDLPDADPIRLGTFHEQSRQLVRDSVRFCWAYARLLGIKADVVDQRLLSRAFCNGESER